MKRNHYWGLALLFSFGVLAETASANSHPELTDEKIVAEFQSLGSQIVEGIRIVGPESFPKINFEKLEDAVLPENTKIVVVKNTHGLFHVRTASNTPGKKLIEIRRKNWLNAVERLPLVLHEYLGISGQEASETYDVSTEVIRVMRKKLFEREEPILEKAPKFDLCSTTYFKYAVERHIRNRNTKLSLFVVLAGVSTFPVIYGTILLGPIVGLAASAINSGIAVEALAGLFGTTYLGIKKEVPMKHPVTPGENWYAKVFRILDFSSEQNEELQKFENTLVESYRSQTGDDGTSTDELKSRILKILHYGDGSGEFCPPEHPLNKQQIASYVLEKMSPVDRHQTF